MDAPDTTIYAKSAIPDKAVTRPQEPARTRLRGVKTKLPYHEHPLIAGHSFKKLSESLDHLFLAGPFDYGMAHQAVDQAAVFYYRYDKQSPHDIEPDRYVAYTQHLIHDLKDPKSDLWEIINWAHVRAYNEPIGKDRQAMIVQEAVSKLNDDIPFRLRYPEDAEALKRLDFKMEPLRQELMATIKYWAADEEKHPVHELLQAAAKLDPALRPALDKASDQHIMNREGISHLEERLQTLLKKDLQDHGGKLTRGHKIDQDRALLKKIENVMVDFLFYSQPGTRPIDIKPLAFSNKAIEAWYDGHLVSHRDFKGNLHDMLRDDASIEHDRTHGAYQQEKVPESYGVENKYSVYKALASAFHKTYGYDIPLQAMIAVKDAMAGQSYAKQDVRLKMGLPLPRLQHEIHVARFDPGMAKDDADKAALAWFVAGKNAIEDGRGFLLIQLIELAKDRTFDQPLIAQMAAATIEHYRTMAPTQWKSLYTHLDDGSVKLTGYTTAYDRSFEILMDTARILADEKAWKPFAVAYAETHDGRSPPPEIARSYQREVVQAFQKKVTQELGFHLESGDTLALLARHETSPFDQGVNEAHELENETRRRMAGMIHHVKWMDVAPMMQLPPPTHADRLQMPPSGMPHAR